MTRVLIWLILLVSPSAFSSEDDAVVYQIKASYIYNFLQFVQFDQQSLTSANEITVCIVGENRFGAALDRLSDARVPQGKIRILLLANNVSTKALAPCHVVYLVGTSLPLARQMLANLDRDNVLTIGEFPAFIDAGGYIELFIREDSVRFRVNMSLAGQTAFNVASQLLSLGESGV